MTIHDELGKRMKEFYEQVPKTRLVRRMPVIIRLDGKAFHTFTKRLKKPFDYVLMGSMQDTMKYLCENIQGCVLGYQQSDEITLVLIDYRTLNESAWFDYEVQKMCSIAASMATLAFNRAFGERVADCEEHYFSQCAMDDGVEYLHVLNAALKRGAMFDARCFNIPKEEVTNCIYWRQLDAVRNSIEMVGQANFTHAELHKKSCNMIQDMLFTQKGINWNDFPADCKRGCCCVKEEYEEIKETGPIIRSRWVIDHETPIFKGENRNYINSRILYNEQAFLAREETV